MNIVERDIEGIHKIELDPYEDERGSFMRVYDQEVFEQHGIDSNWVQHSHSISRHEGTLRGLHFQFPPQNEAKLVRVINGGLFDVYLDLRYGSPTYGEWGSITLTAENDTLVYIPRGFAHGFCTLTDDCEVLYWIDNYYDPELQGTIRWDSPSLDIPWPVEDPIVSEKDAEASDLYTFTEEHEGIDL